MLVGEDGRGALDEVPEQRRRALRCHVLRDRLERRHALRQGRCRRSSAPSPSPRSTRSRPVVPDRLGEQLGAREADPSELVDKTPAHIGADPAGPPVGDRAVRPERAEVPAPRRRPALDRNRSRRLEHAAADAVAQRIVAEQAEVPGALPGGAGATGIGRPHTLAATRASRFGVDAASSSVSPLARSAGRPGHPRPGGRSSTGSRSRSCLIRSSMVFLPDSSDHARRRGAARARPTRRMARRW